MAAVVTGFFDASGHYSDNDKKVVTVGGFIADESSLDRLKSRWREALERYGIDQFRMTAFVSGRTGFEQFRDQPDLQVTVLNTLVDIIQENVLVSIATTIRNEDWQAVNGEYRLAECALAPFAMGGFSVLNKATRWFGAQGHDFDRFVFERGDAGANNLMRQMNEVISLAPDALEPVRPTFEGKDWSPLQAADLAVWELRNAFEQKERGDYVGPRASFRRLIEIPNQWGILQRDQMIEWITDQFAVPKRTEPWDRKNWRPRFGDARELAATRRARLDASTAPKAP